MRPAVLFLIGIVLGALVTYFAVARDAGGSMLMMRTGGDTVIINAKKDTVIINAQKDTIIINAVSSDYCDRTKPKPAWCP
jgi:hypothetical protein